MPPTPSKTRAVKAEKPAPKKSAVKPEQLLNKVLTGVKSAHKGRSVVFREGDVNKKQEKLLKIDGTTVAYVSVLQNGDVRALKRSLGLSKKGNVDEVVKEITAKVKAGPQITPKKKQPVKAPVKATPARKPRGSGGSARKQEKPKPTAEPQSAAAPEADKPTEQPTEPSSEDVSSSS